MPGVTLKPTCTSPPFTERWTATCSGYRVSHTDKGKSPPRTKYRNNLRKTKHVFLKTKREKTVRTSREWITRDKFSGLGITSAFCPTFFSLLRVILRFYFAFSPRYIQFRHIYSRITSIGINGTSLVPDMVCPDLLGYTTLAARPFVF